MTLALLHQFARRIAGALPLALLATLISFVLLFEVGDPAAVIAGEHASPERLAEINERLGLGRGVLVQYADWLTSAARGDFGDSWHNRGATSTLVLRHAAPTLSLIVLAMAASVIGSTIAGAAAGLRPGGWFDRATRGLATLGLAIPNFLLGLLLVLLFAVTLSWLPAAGYRSFQEGWGTAMRYLTLPAAALTLSLLCQQMRTFRVSILKEYQTDYVRTARMKGVTERAIFPRHVARNAAAPLVTVLGLEAGVLITGSILVESVFAIPGLGSLLVQSIQTQDFPIVQALVASSAIVVLLANLAADIAARWLHPAAELA